jgi:hypothetical protein
MQTPRSQNPSALTTDQKVGSSSLSGRAPFASAHGNPSGSFKFGFAEHPRADRVATSTLFCCMTERDTIVAWLKRSPFDSTKKLSAPLAYSKPRA